jgi:AcrR family transcriptional regulator
MGAPFCPGSVPRAGRARSVRCGAVSSSTRTRIAPDVRRVQIVEATHRVTLAKGLHDLRIIDVAAELGVSTGLIHYHFDTKDDLIAAMLGAMAERETASVRRSIGRLATPEAQLVRLIEVYLPSSRRDRSWLLWIDVWGEALRDANLRRISEELDNAWVELVAEIIERGVAAGSFRTADPVAAAWRLCALLDGLGLQVVLHHGTMTRAQMHKHVQRTAARELGYDLVD